MSRPKKSLFLYLLLLAMIAKYCCLAAPVEFKRLEKWKPNNHPSSFLDRYFSVLGELFSNPPNLSKRKSTENFTLLITEYILSLGTATDEGCDESLDFGKHQDKITISKHFNLALPFLGEEELFALVATAPKKSNYSLHGALKRCAIALCKNYVQHNELCMNDEYFKLLFLGAQPVPQGYILHIIGNALDFIHKADSYRIAQSLYDAKITAQQWIAQNFESIRLNPDAPVEKIARFITETEPYLAFLHIKPFFELNAMAKFSNVISSDPGLERKMMHWSKLSDMDKAGVWMEFLVATESVFPAIFGIIGQTENWHSSMKSGETINITDFTSWLRDDIIPYIINVIKLIETRFVSTGLIFGDCDVLTTLPLRTWYALEHLIWEMKPILTFESPSLVEVRKELLNYQFHSSRLALARNYLKLQRRSPLSIHDITDFARDNLDQVLRMNNFQTRLELLSTGNTLVHMLLQNAEALHAKQITSIEGIKQFFLENEKFWKLKEEDDKNFGEASTSTDFHFEAEDADFSAIVSKFDSIVPSNRMEHFAEGVYTHTPGGPVSGNIKGWTEYFIQMKLLQVVKKYLVVLQESPLDAPQIAVEKFQALHMNACASADEIAQFITEIHPYLDHLHKVVYSFEGYEPSITLTDGLSGTIQGPTAEDFLILLTSLSSKSSRIKMQLETWLGLMQNNQLIELADLTFWLQKDIFPYMKEIETLLEPRYASYCLGDDRRIITSSLTTLNDVKAFLAGLNPKLPIEWVNDQNFRKMVLKYNILDCRFALALNYRLFQWKPHVSLGDLIHFLEENIVHVNSKIENETNFELLDIGKTPETVIKKNAIYFFHMKKTSLAQDITEFVMDIDKFWKVNEAVCFKFRDSSVLNAATFGEHEIYQKFKLLEEVTYPSIKKIAQFITEGAPYLSDEKLHLSPVVIESMSNVDFMSKPTSFNVGSFKIYNLLISSNILKRTLGGWRDDQRNINDFNIAESSSNNIYSYIKKVETLLEPNSRESWLKARDQNILVTFLETWLELHSFFGDMKLQLPVDWSSDREVIENLEYNINHSGLALAHTYRSLQLQSLTSIYNLKHFIRSNLGHVKLMERCRAILDIISAENTQIPLDEINIQKEVYKKNRDLDAGELVARPSIENTKSDLKPPNDSNPSHCMQESAGVFHHDTSGVPCESSGSLSQKLSLLSD